MRFFLSVTSDLLLLLPSQFPSPSLLPTSSFLEGEDDDDLLLPSTVLSLSAFDSKLLSGSVVEVPAESVVTIVSCAAVAVEATTGSETEKAVAGMVTTVAVEGASRMPFVEV